MLLCFLLFLLYLTDETGEAMSSPGPSNDISGDEASIIDENSNVEDDNNDQNTEASKDLTVSTKKLNKSNFKESLYHYYCGELVSKGVFKWRINSPYKKLAVMNDYSSESGNYMVGFFSVTVAIWMK